jgi:flavin reductase (DIM6/NTAB) family NADH-FMN oxidoreductase RutF
MPPPEEHPVPDGVIETEVAEPGGPPTPATPAQSAGFREAMRLLASGVVMVTTRQDGRPWGLTISACCSLSADPPQILISLGSETVTCRQVLATGQFGLSLLATKHRELAEAGAAPGVPKFVDDYCDDCDDPAERLPRVRGALYHLDCTVTDTHRIADHTVIVGEVRHAHSGAASGEADPLIYFDRAYRQVGSGLA